MRPQDRLVYAGMLVLWGWALYASYAPSSGPQKAAGPVEERLSARGGELSAVSTAAPLSEDLAALQRGSEPAAAASGVPSSLLIGVGCQKCKVPLVSG
jgi:hypothetical protein